MALDQVTIDGITLSYARRPNTFRDRMQTFGAPSIHYRPTRARR